MDTDTTRSKHDNIDKKLQVQWNQTKYIVLEAHEITLISGKKGLLQLMGPTHSRTWGLRGKNSNILRKKNNCKRQQD